MGPVRPAASALPCPASLPGCAPPRRTVQTAPRLARRRPPAQLPTVVPRLRRPAQGRPHKVSFVSAVTGPASTHFQPQSAVGGGGERQGRGRQEHKRRRLGRPPCESFQARPHARPSRSPPTCEPGWPHSARSPSARQISHGLSHADPRKGGKIPFSAMRSDAPMTHTEARAWGDPKEEQVPAAQ
ncbi:uncharacterized protein VTP21DRAFT_9383 [Calcarisporiella thermophila]|uniref:uncharacterized protein n=1 Tax=Calcarisporiella thermophila TaxID=911321 RepID=UPI003743B2DD